MNKQREAMQFALETLEDIFGKIKIDVTAINMLREALAEQEQKPVAWMYHGILHNGTLHDRPTLIWRPQYMDAMSAKMGAKATPLYTAPPQQAEPVEPVFEVGFGWLDDATKYPKGTKLYTAPPQRKSLTDEEIDNLELPPNGCTIRELVRAIERAHGIGD